MSQTTNLKLELVNPDSSEIFSVDKYVTSNFKAIDAIDMTNRLNSLETSVGNLRLYDGTYTGTGTLTRTQTLTNFRPSIIFMFQTSAGAGSEVLMIKCPWFLDPEPANMDVSALSSLIPLGTGYGQDDHTHITTNTYMVGEDRKYEITRTVDAGYSPKYIMNESGKTYKYIMIGGSY